MTTFFPLFLRVSFDRNIRSFYDYAPDPRPAIDFTVLQLRELSPLHPRFSFSVRTLYLGSNYQQIKPPLIRLIFVNVLVLTCSAQS